jgi:murein DD-endopeptidase MepM/ murein hydrolase activator NlpD
MRYHPVYKRRKFHTGIDIAESKGTPVYATGNGVITRKGYCSGYGNFIEIEHAGNFRSVYAHLSRTMVNIGDSVSISQQIACVGNTGIATGSHLHYEVRKGKRFLNPSGWCSCLFDILKNNNKQNQYEFSKISITTGGGNNIPCADSLFPLYRAVMPYGRLFHSV